MNILIYYQSTSYSLLIESMLKWLNLNEQNVFVLVIGTNHDKLEVNYSSLHNAKTEYYSTSCNSFLSYIQYTKNFINFCKKNKIDIVFSHLQLCNLFAVLAQPFIKAKVVPTRHHIDVTRLVGNQKSIYIDKLINRLSKKIVVLSKTAKLDLINNEGVASSKIVPIPLGYDFEIIPKIDRNKVEQIQKQFDCQTLLITVARMEVTKRHDCVIECLNELLEKGVDAKLLLTNSIKENPTLTRMVEDLGLSKRVFFIGHRKDVRDYMAAADFLLHPSVSESSNQVVREAAMAGTPSILVRGIGDFDEYIVHQQNAFVVSKEQTVKEMTTIILDNKDKHKFLKEIIQNLQEVTRKRFNVHESMPLYMSLADDLI